jgi:hypothetical protein
LTERTRFLLWQDVMVSGHMLERWLSEWDEHEGREPVPVDLPPMVRNQPREWWIQMLGWYRRVEESLRTGERDLGSVAAEVVLQSSCYDHIDAGDLEVEELAVFEALPESSDPDLADFDWDEIVGSLCDDTDVELLWQPQMDGIEHPADQLNVKMAIGDMRPASWFDPA